MYVCICNNVTESDIHQTVNDGAYSLDCLARELAVSTCCGQCRCFADDVLHDALRAAGAREQGRGAEHASVA